MKIIYKKNCFVVFDINNYIFGTIDWIPQFSIKINFDNVTWQVIVILLIDGKIFIGSHIKRFIRSSVKIYFFKIREREENFDQVTLSKGIVVSQINFSFLLNLGERKKVNVFGEEKVKTHFFWASIFY